jgi:hypothetical protein
MAESWRPSRTRPPDAGETLRRGRARSRPQSPPEGERMRTEPSAGPGPQDPRLRKVTAIVAVGALEKVLQRLRDLLVPGISVM